MGLFSSRNRLEALPCNPFCLTLSDHAIWWLRLTARMWTSKTADVGFQKACDLGKAVPTRPAAHNPFWTRTLKPRPTNANSCSFFVYSPALKIYELSIPLLMLTLPWRALVHKEQLLVVAAVCHLHNQLGHLSKQATNTVVLAAHVGALGLSRFCGQPSCSRSSWLVSFHQFVGA